MSYRSKKIRNTVAAPRMVAVNAVAAAVAGVLYCASGAYAADEAATANVATETGLAHL